jgi:predicted NACHT family NTPase
LPLFEADQVTFSEARKEELVAALTATLNKSHLTPEILTERNLEPTALAKHLLTFQPETTRDFSEPEREFFHRAISETSRSIVDIATRLPSFNERTFAEILKRETQLITITNEILEEVRRIREQSQQENVVMAAAKFEEDYLLTVIRRLDELQLFGVDVSKASKRHKLSVAYVTLSVEQKLSQTSPALRPFDEPAEVEAADEEDEEDTRIVLPVDRVLADARRLLVRGSAGSGKTTLMQWIAVNSAGRKFEQALSDWNNTIPFYIRLREFVDKPLPAPEDFPKLLASTIVAEMPPRWAHEKLRADQAIVLIDGVDELPETRRDEVRQ